MDDTVDQSDPRVWQATCSIVRSEGSGKDSYFMTGGYETNCFTGMERRVTRILESEPRCSGILHSVMRGFLTEVSGQHTGSILKGKRSLPWRLNMEPVNCPETSVRNCHYTLRNSPEERKSHVLRGGILKPCITRSLVSSFVSRYFGVLDQSIQRWSVTGIMNFKKIAINYWVSLYLAQYFKIFFESSKSSYFYNIHFAAIVQPVGFWPLEGPQPISYAAGS